MSADLRARLQPLAPLMEAARRALKETPFRLGDDPDDLLAAVVIAISAELSGPSLAVMDKLKQAEAERDRLRTALERDLAEANEDLRKATAIQECTERDFARLRQGLAERDQLRAAAEQVRAALAKWEEDTVHDADALGFLLDDLRAALGQAPAAEQDGGGR